MKIRLPKLNQWQKIVRNILIGLFLVCLGMYSSLFGVLNSETAFDRLVNSFMIDDYKVIGYVDNSRGYERKYLAETEDYYLLGSTYRDGLLWWSSSMLYEYKKEDIVLFPLDFAGEGEVAVKFIMFTELEDINRAKLIVTIDETAVTKSNPSDVKENPSFGKQVYEITSDLMEEGYFHFTMEKKYEGYISERSREEQEYFRILNLYGNPIRGRENENITLWVELYNSDGEVVTAQEISRPNFE